ncbi:hypothetical protein SAMN06269185_2516 [Natronoarchaeum philippinense]|uniref:PPC domain-containing protein n=1 Tax=Natronoarchaeum philippinense TaxID=558529 RepID=A0A285P322_NATPI|nr:PPC domain-containing DNA-binding protein [Natronoarchaeum philippinense]SNZ15553.1 hypothetical protein SAMN06269185_2516 [Natronoarchaeum philippinense]
MEYREVNTTRKLLVRLRDGEELRAGIERAVDDAGADAGWFVGFGGLRNATLWFYDQEERRYDDRTFDEPLELTLCIGNVASVDGNTFAHTHVTVSDMRGNSVGGHLESAEAFVGEIYVELFEDAVERRSEATPVLETESWRSAAIDADPTAHEATGLTLNHTGSGDD